MLLKQKAKDRIERSEKIEKSSVAKKENTLKKKIRKMSILKRVSKGKRNYPETEKSNMVRENDNLK